MAEKRHPLLLNNHPNSTAHCPTSTAHPGQNDATAIIPVSTSVVVPAAPSHAIVLVAASHAIVLAANFKVIVSVAMSHKVQVGLSVFVLEWSINELPFPDVYQEPYHPLWWAETSGKSPFSFTPSTSSSIHFSPLSKLQWWCFLVLQTCLAKRSGTNLLGDLTILLLGKCKVECTIWHNNFWHRIHTTKNN